MRQMLIRYSLLLNLVFHTQSYAEFYRWTDTAGQVHYSDAVPPEDTQAGHTELNKTGIHIKQVAAAPNKDILDAQAKALLQQKTTEEAQKKYDETLLAKYTDTAQLDAGFKEKIVLLDNNVQTMQKRRTLLSMRLTTLKTQVKTLDPVKDKITIAELTTFTTEAETTLKSYEKALEDTLKEKLELTETYNKDKLRLTELLLKASEEKAKKTATTTTK